MKKNVLLIKRSEPPLGVVISKAIIYLDSKEVLPSLSELVYMNPNLYSYKTNFLLHFLSFLYVSD